MWRPEGCGVLGYRVCWTFGFAPYARVPFGIAPKGTKNASPTIRPCASLRVPSLRRRSGGRQNGPSLARLCLSRHPCRSTPYTTTTLGLLTGRGRSKARSKAKADQDQRPLSLTLSRKRERGLIVHGLSLTSPLSRLRGRGGGGGVLICFWSLISRPS